MRVIAGKARKLALKTVAGQDTRPTTDRIKETLFNILQMDIPGCTFLDLFAGSGGIGIEALSRGAKRAVFVEQNKAALDCIKDNLAFTKLAADAEVIGRDVMTALQLMEDRPAFDIIFMDPPYGQGHEQMVLTALERSGLADMDTLLIIEADIETDFSWVTDTGFEIIRYKRYRTNMHVFLRRKENTI